MSKIAFIGNFQYNCGSSNALLGYARAGARLGHDIRASEFGFIDNNIRKSVPIAERNWKADVFVIIYESYPFLSEKDIDELCRITTFSKRLIIDPDGKYLAPCFNENDTNHSKPESYIYWTNLYDHLSNKILQPTLEPTQKSNIYQFLYFGLDSETPSFEHVHKDFDMLYVGNNWYRWHDIEFLTEILSPIRNKVNSFALIGQYWTGKSMKNFENATKSNPQFLEKNNIQVYESAEYGEVESTMSKGKINPILIRPILNTLGFITPRMLETFAANTVPLIPNYFKHTNKLYGMGAEELRLSSTSKASDHILKVLDNYAKFMKLTEEIRNRLLKNHSYEIRINQLLDMV